MTKNSTVSKVLEKEYQYGFLTQIESEKIPKGINENIIRLISEKKKEPEFYKEHDKYGFQEPLFVFSKASLTSGGI